MTYPATLTTEGRFYLVTFRDIPEAITQGESWAEAVEQASLALESALDFYLQDQRPVPLPSAMEHGEVAVRVDAELVSRIVAHNRQGSGDTVSVAA